MSYRISLVVLLTLLRVAKSHWKMRRQSILWKPRVW